MTIRTLIVDDEPAARRGIRRLLEAEADVMLLAECAHGEAAVQAITTQQPDLVFLDVQMPGLSGFEVLRAVGPRHLPLVIFVTAYDQYALRAFDVHAVDYLLKPFDDERFQAALDHARATLRQRRMDLFEQKMQDLLGAIEDYSTPPRRPAYLERMAVRSGGHVQVVRMQEVDWIEAAGDYVCLHVQEGGKHYIRETMQALEEKLDPRRFVRIHRSAFVNLERIRELRSEESGYAVLLHDGTELKLSRTYQAQVLALLDERA